MTDKPDFDALAEMEATAAAKALNMRRVHYPGSRGAAYFPETATDVDDWERRCLAMHQEQETLVPPEKPAENVTLERKKTMTAGINTFEFVKV